MQVQNRKTKCDLTMTGRETIHSGQFMVSHFEAEEQDDDEHSLVPEPARKVVVEGIKPQNIEISKTREKCSPQIDSSLAKLFQCMSLAYRQKLTSPKWNRFKGIRLRWKDKIRLNNVIWRCWHMQFVLKQNSLVCQFASPLDVDTHNKPEAVVLEGKYWKRKLAAVTAEYKKWRMFSRNRILGYGTKDSSDLPDIEFMDWGVPSMLVDDDYMQLMSDTLFSTISNQVFAFPDSREIARGAGLADFIQPSLGPLQPNLDDYMDTLQPLHDLLEAKLAPVVEEISMDTNTNNNIGTAGSYLHNYDTANMESANYSISNYLGNTSIIAPERTSINRTKSLSNVFLSMRGENSHAPANYSMYPLPNVSTQKLQNQSIFSNQNVINQAQLISVDTNMNVQPNSTVSLSNLSNIQGNMNMNNLNMPSDFTSPSNVTGEQGAPKIVSNILASNPNKEIKQKAPTMHLSTAAHHHSMNTAPNSSITLPFYRISANQQSCKARNNTTECNKNITSKKQSSKEMFRSNSLPLNSTLNLQEDLLGSTRSNVKHNIPQHGSRDKLSSAYCSVTDSSLRPSNVLLAQLLTSKQSVASSSNVTNNKVNTQQSPRFADESTILISTIPNSNQFMPSLSPQSPDLVPTSPDGSVSPPMGKNSRYPPREIRRVGHTHAEQKRRYNIKNGFDVLHSLIPYLQQNPTNKLSKAAMLHKGAEYIKQLQVERKSLEDEIISLKSQAESLNISISNSQSKLPATGAPVSRRKTGRICEMFREYIHARTLEDWKFWIFSLLVEPLLFTFNSSVSTINMQELCRTTIHWVDQHCSLVDLRPGVLNALRLVCTTTDILSQPERLPEQARNAVANQYQQY